MNGTMRSLIGSLSMVAGACIYTSSNMVGNGWEIRPDPVRGLLLASAGMMMCVLAMVLMPEGCTRRDILNLLKAVLILGSFSLIATLGMAVVQPFYDLNNTRWGAIPPPNIIFGALYGVVSIGAMLALELWEHRSPGYQAN